VRRRTAALGLPPEDELWTAGRALDLSKTLVAPSFAASIRFVVLHRCE